MGTSNRGNALRAAAHVDHEMSQFLRLHLAMQAPEYRSYPEPIRRAVYVAYGTHLRVLLEFFIAQTAEAGRKALCLRRRRADIRCVDHWPEAAAPSWTKQEYTRWDTDRKSVV